MIDLSLPSDVAARLEEHTAGGYVLFRVAANGQVVYDCSFDDEVSFLALTSKALTTMKAIQALSEEQIAMLISHEGEAIEDEEDGSEF